MDNTRKVINKDQPVIDSLSGVDYVNQDDYFLYQISKIILFN